MSAPAAVAGVVTGSMGAADATDSGSTATQPAAPSSEQDWFRSRMAALTPHQRGAWGEATLLAEIHRLQHRVLIEHFGQSTQPGYDCASWDGHTLHVWEAKNYSVRETDKAGVVYDLNALYHHRVAANVRQFLKDLPENDSDRAGIPTPTWSQRRRCSSWNRSSHRRRQRRAKATPATRSGEVSMAGLNTQVTELDDDWRALRQRWEDVKAVWNDPVRWNFEKEHWESLEKQAEATRREMARLADVIARARQSVK